MALPYTDDFTDTNGTLLTAHSANWTLVAGTSPDIQSNGVCPNASAADSLLYLNSETPNNNQYSKMVFVSYTNDDVAINPAVRCSTTELTGYCSYLTGFNGGQVVLLKAVNNSWSQLGSMVTGRNFVANDENYIQAVGDQITVKHNSTTIIGPQTDTAIESGRLGIQSYGDSTSVNMTSWEGGDLPEPSESVSPSISPSASLSQSASLSASPSVSPSVSPSASVSPSVSPSVGGLTEATVCWGHVTGVTEDNVRTFTGNWTGTGSIEDAGNAEKICLEAGQSMTSEVVITATQTVVLLQNSYDVTGDNVLMEYRHGNSEAACLAAAWNTYVAPFDSLGYVQIRLTSTL